MTAILMNSGNFGLPVQELAFKPFGLHVQARMLQVFVIVAQNFLTFTYGVLLLAAGRRDVSWRKSLLHILKFPPLYALAAAVGTVLIRNALGARAPAVGQALAPFWQVCLYVKDAFLAVALGTLGAQLAEVARRGGSRGRGPVVLSVLLRLVAGPVVGLGLIYALGIRGFLAQVLLVGAGGPTAVNCMLMCLEFDAHPEDAAKAVFYSTLLSPVTVTLTILVAQSGVLPGFALSP